MSSSDRGGFQDLRGGWSAAMGLEFITLGEEEVVVEWTTGPEHLQPFGIVHGGVHCGVVETVCSVGASLNAPAGHQIVGVENHTSFLRPVRPGVRLRATGTPIQRGRRAQLWEARITDERGRLVATGRVRLFNVPMDPKPEE